MYERRLPYKKRHEFNSLTTGASGRPTQPSRWVVVGVLFSARTMSDLPEV